MRPLSNGTHTLSGEVYKWENCMKPCGPPSPALLQLMKSANAAFEAFKEAKLPMLKEENPGLSDNQYKDMVSRLWNQSLENPLNQVDTITKEMLAVRPV